MKAVIFARVSSREQEETGYSLPAQTKLLNQYAEKNSFEVIKIFSIAESASGQKERASFHEMLKYSRKNNVKIIICEKVDRLTRNQRDAVKVDDWMKEDTERQIHFVKSNSILHAESKSTDKFVWNMHVSVAQLHIDNLSEEVKKGQKEKLAQGWFPAKPPLGYKTIGESGHKIHVIDASVKPFIIDMFSLYASGEYSLSRLTEYLYKKGLRYKNGMGVSRSSIHLLLSNPFYYGKMLWNGETYQGKHEATISYDQYQQVQEKLNRKETPKYSKHFFLFRQMIYCKTCTGTITWETQKGHHYGHCNHFKPCSNSTYVKEKDIEQQLIKAFTRLQIKNPRINEWLIKALNFQQLDNVENSKKIMSDIQNKLSIIEKKIDTLYDDKAGGIISKEFYERKQKQYLDEKEELVASINTNSLSNANNSKAALDIFKLSQKVSSIYKKAKPVHKRELMKLVFEKMYLDGDDLEYVYTDGFILLLAIVNAFNGSKLNNIDEILNNSFEQDEKLARIRQVDEYNQLYPELLGDMDSNHGKQIQSLLSYR